MDIFGLVYWIKNTERQLDGIEVDKTFTDKALGKDTKQPQLELMMSFVRSGDTVIVHSMDRPARNVDDLRQIRQTLTGRGVHIEFVKEHLTHVKTDVICPGVIHEFDRALIKEQQREEIALAKKRGAFKGRKKSLSHAVFIQERSLRDREKRQ